MKTYGQYIRAERRRKGYSMHELAKMADMKYSSIWRIEMDLPVRCKDTSRLRTAISSAPDLRNYCVELTARMWRRGITTKQVLGFSGLSIQTVKRAMRAEKIPRKRTRYILDQTIAKISRIASQCERPCFEEFTGAHARE